MKTDYGQGTLNQNNNRWTWMEDAVWRSEIKLEDGRDSAIGIDSGIKLHSDQNPRITAIELNSGRIISQREIEHDE